ncbi:hypothetical protein PPL_07153 [Heterostelium album PN500]|uniref:Uncharacterized protein n=1 Tax=Heterostelium pallidum (strain ATCC 26659 / Pp 5 / PN500) TaxID=670386 RepID=D3BEJ1_HETP5|nr:hypothetical protein PPL_07153 [Heterostelium album PN500]EFA80322.1 hypothetical protein PPL_07153 [Heterostelium album PN500]|eukprot:XP_020432442.1 hypothetical protein PPL_07153 [Heterostelium album PN500]
MSDLVLNLDYAQSSSNNIFGLNEKKSIESYLVNKGVRSPKDILFSGVFTDLKKKKVWEINSKQTEEERLLVVSQFRLNIFSSNGKFVSDGHLLDVVEYTPTDGAVTIKLRNGVIQFNSVQNKLDELSLAIKKMFSLNFPGMPGSDPVVSKEIGACFGFARTYRCVSDFYGIPVRDDICWEINNLYEANNIRDFNLSDWPETPTPAQGKAMIESLKYNSWFESISIFNNPSCKVSNDGILSLNATLQTNKKLQKLVLQNINARESWITPETWMTFAMNNYVHTIDLSCNAIEDRGTMGLCNDWLATVGHEIQSINLAKCGIGKQGMSLLFKTLRENKWISKNIKFLSVSGNKIEESGTEMVSFLADAVALKHFEMSNCSIVWSSLKPAANIQRSKETRMITRLDLSQNKLNTSSKPDFENLAAFLQLITPNLADLDMGSTVLPVGAINLVLSATPNLMRLDLSDNELGEEGIVTLVDTLMRTTLPKLKHLFINRNVGSATPTDFISQTLSLTRVTQSIKGTSSASAANAIKALVQLISPNAFALCPLESLHIAGSSNGRLKAEIIPLAQALLKNDTIFEIDISGHHAGDDLAIALGRVIQVNKTIRTLYWDENLTTTVGMEYFSMGFRRNQTLLHMPLPVLDVGEVLKLPENSPAMQLIKERLKLGDSTTTVQQRVTQLASEIQSQIINNNLRKMKDVINKARERQRAEVAISQSMKNASLNSPQAGTPAASSTPNIQSKSSSPDGLVEEQI